MCSSNLSLLTHARRAEKAERKAKLLTSKRDNVQELKRQVNNERSLRLSVEQTARRAEENADNYRRAEEEKLDAKKEKKIVIQRFSILSLLCVHLI